MLVSGERKRGGKSNFSAMQISKQHLFPDQWWLLNGQSTIWRDLHVTSPLNGGLHLEIAFSCGDKFRNTDQNHRISSNSATTQFVLCLQFPVMKKGNNPHTWYHQTVPSSGYNHHSFFQNHFSWNHPTARTWIELEKHEWRLPNT